MPAPEEVIDNEDTTPSPGPEDSDPSNIMFRAGYLWSMALKLDSGEDRTFLLRASRSLVAYAESLRADL